MQRFRPTLRHILAASAALALTGGIALGAAAMGPEGMSEGFHRFLEDMDADNSNTVTRSEIEAATAARAAEIDADKDGTVTAEELLAWRDAQRQKRAAEHLAAMDSDRDGTVSVAEFEAAATWRLARLDRDGDGTIDPREMQRHRSHGHRLGDRHGVAPLQSGEPEAD